MTLGGHLLVKALAEHGAQRAFCVAGESYLPVLDGFLNYPDIDVVTCRHESGATFMAEAYGQLSNTPGVALVTRGPGACNASIGVHTAWQSSTPMILLVGLIGTADKDKHAFQEFDLPQMFGSLSKWATVIDRADRIPEYIARAWHIATSGRPGPVVLGLPEEVVFGEVVDQEIRRIPVQPLKPAESDLAAVREKLSGASKPVVIVGGGGWSDAACADLESFVSASHLPVTCAFRRHDIFSHTNGNYIGELGSGPNPALVERVKQADVILCLGGRLDEMTTQEYKLIQPHHEIIHVHPSPDIFGQSSIPAMTVQAHLPEFIAAMAAGKKVDGRGWAAWRDEGRTAYQDWSAIDLGNQPSWKGANMTAIFAQLRDAMPKDSIVTTDAGNFSGWCQRYIPYGRPGRLLAPIAGAMGYAVPTAIAASIEHPDRLVMGFCGDGGFMMSCNELATAIRHGAKPIIFVCNNNMYGTIYMHQEKHYPGRVSATGLTNPDFVKMAESYGAFSARVTDADQFENIFEKAHAADTFALIEIQMDPRQLTTNSKI